MAARRPFTSRRVSFDPLPEDFLGDSEDAGCLLLGAAGDRDVSTAGAAGAAAAPPPSCFTGKERAEGNVSRGRAGAIG